MISGKGEMQTVQIGPEMVRAWSVEIAGSWIATRVRRVEGADFWTAIELYPKGWLLFSWFPEACGCGTVSRETLDRLLKVARRQPPISLAIKSQLVGARLTAVEQLNADRVMALVFSRPVGFGISKERTLVLEASPRFSNLLLADEGMKVLEMECHGRPREGGIERNRPGLPYLPPPEVKGIPPSNWPHVISPEDLPGFKGIGKGLVETLKNHWETAEKLREALSRLYSQDAAPRLEDFLPQRSGKALLVFPILLPTALEIRGTPLEATGAVLAEALIERASRSSGRKAGVSFGEAARHLRNRLEGLSRQLAECLQADVWKRRGEALLASSEEIPEGCSEAEIRFWGASGPETIHIPLDPRLTRIENAQACFKLYRKGQSIKESVEAEISRIRKEIAALEQDELLAEALALCGKGGRQGKSESGREKKGTKDSGVVRFEIEGFPILVGTSAKGNRHVTFKLASPEDLWFHVKDLPGAHVVVKTGKRPVPSHVLERVAAIAAFFSKARTDPLAVVEMTEKRHVKSRQGENVGGVFYSHSSAFTVKPGLPGEVP
jgi:predicted ribosome quality control (RQC) complex YloA/Tae2 family protein